MNPQTSFFPAIRKNSLKYSKVVNPDELMGSYSTSVPEPWLHIALQDIILWVTMEKLANALPILQAHVGGASTMENEIDRALSMLRRWWPDTFCGGWVALDAFCIAFCGISAAKLAEFAPALKGQEKEWMTTGKDEYTAACWHSILLLKHL